MLYHRLKVTLQPEDTADFAKELADFKKDLAPAQAAARASESGKDFDRDAVARMAQPLQDFQVMSDYGYALIVPPIPPAARGHWVNAGTCLLDSARSNEIHPAMSYYAAMATAYHQHKPDEFNQALTGYQEWLKPRFAHEMAKGQAEFYYNNVKSFLHATIIYICALVLACGAIMTFGVVPNVFYPSRYAGRRSTWSFLPASSTRSV